MPASIALTGLDCRPISAAVLGVVITMQSIDGPPSEIGEKVGAASHIASFWRYRFPEGRPPVASVDEAVDILQDFEASLGEPLLV